MKLISCLVVLVFSAACALAQDEPSTKLPPGDSPPPTATQMLIDTGAADDFDNAAYVVVADSSRSVISEEGVAKTHIYMLYKILTEDGCQEMSVLRWHYEPLSSYIEVREVNLIRGDSTISLALDGLRDLPAPQHGIYWSDRIIIMQLPRLHVGDGIEVKVYRKGYSYALLDGNEPPDDKYIPPMAGEYFDIVLFQSDVPIISKHYSLSMPSGKRIQSQVFNGPMYSKTSFLGDTTTYTWWSENMAAWEDQRYHPDPPDMLPKVVITTAESWEAKSRWFFDVNRNQFEFTPAIKAKVDEIFKEAGVTKGTEEQKAFELVHWVAQNIRYSGQTMGEGEGFTLHPGAMIFEQRSGVCKDIAGMLITMMRAAGMDSYGAMTMAGSRIEDLPADQFNHCVVALRKDDGRFVMYDPTWVPFVRNIWSKYETEQHYLIGSPEGEDLTHIAYSPPEESRLQVNNKCKILEDGSLEGTLILEGTGSMDGRLRGYGHWFRLDQIENYIARTIGRACERVNIIDIKHGDILDFHINMNWEIKYSIPDYAMIIDNAYEFKSPLLIMNANSLYYYLGYNYPEERNGDLFFYTTSHLDSEEEIKLPGGYKVIDPPELSEDDETYIYTSYEGGMKGSTFNLKQDIKIKRRQVPEDSYKAFAKVMKDANEFTDTVFRATKGGK